MTPQRYHKILNTILYRQNDLTVVMENVHKSHNLAAITRTCDAIGIGRVHAITNRNKLLLSQGVAGGSRRWVDIHIHPSVEEVCRNLKKENFRILAAHFSKDAMDYRSVDFTIPTAILVGQELEGITEQGLLLADKKICIPMYGMVQSLNVSVATAIILYEAQRQRQKKGLYNKTRLSDKEINSIIFEKGYPRLAKEYKKTGRSYPLLDKNGQVREAMKDER
jgi:tRNA (guanosine-2'-O-)-methyltransferase